MSQTGVGGGREALGSCARTERIADGSVVPLSPPRRPSLEPPLPGRALRVSHCVRVAGHQSRGCPSSGTGM